MNTKYQPQLKKKYKMKRDLYARAKKRLEIEMIAKKLQITQNNIINKHMKMMKFTSKTTLRLKNQNGTPIKYKGYELGSLPPKFAYIYDDNKEAFGVNEWFNYKGLTWIKEQKEDLNTYF